MITKKTLPAIIVPSIAPIWMYSARPENRWLTPQAVSVTSNISTAASATSFGISRQRPSYTSQAAIRRATLIVIASHGRRSATDLSIRNVLALK
jgi:hypothetical protein